MCVCALCACVYVCVCEHVRMLAFVCMGACMHEHVYVHVQACMHHACMHELCMYVSMHACEHACLQAEPR